MKQDDISKGRHEFIKKWEKNIFTFLLKNDKDRVSGHAMYKKLFGMKGQRAIMAKQRKRKNNNKDIILSRWRKGKRFQSLWWNLYLHVFLSSFIFCFHSWKNTISSFCLFACSLHDLSFILYFPFSSYWLSVFHFFLNSLILFHFSKFLLFLCFQFYVLSSFSR